MTTGQELTTINSSDLASRSDLLRFIDAWLANRRLSARTREAYADDLSRYVGWCESRSLHPLAAKFTHVNAYSRDLETTINTRTSRPAARATVARRVSAISSWYAYLVALGVLPLNPADAADRVRIDKDESNTTAFTHEDAAAMIAVAPADVVYGGPLGLLLCRMMVDLGLRVSELVALDIADFGHDSGHRTVRLRMKGGKTRIRVLPPPLAVAFDAYLAHRATHEDRDVEDLTGPLLAAADGYQLTRFDVYRFVKRLAKAAHIPGHEAITPHSFRHAWATIARQAGATLEERQHALGHADPRTTQRYDRARASLDRDPSYLVARAVG